MITLFVGIGAAILGFIVGWLVCALMTAGKGEDAYAEGYRQAVRDKETPS